MAKSVCGHAASHVMLVVARDLCCKQILPGNSTCSLHLWGFARKVLDSAWNLASLWAFWVSSHPSPEPLSQYWHIPMTFPCEGTCAAAKRRVACELIPRRCFVALVVVLESSTSRPNFRSTTAIGPSASFTCSSTVSYSHSEAPNFLHLRDSPVEPAAGKPHLIHARCRPYNPDGFEA